MRRILVLRGGALGDFIVTLPALAALRQEWPDSHIELAGNATAAQLGVNRGLLQRAHSQHEARWSALYSDDSLPETFGGWLASFDLVVNYWPDPDRRLARHFPRREDQRFITADALPAQGPAAAHYAAALRAIGITTTHRYFRLERLMAEPAYPPPNQLNSGNATRPVALHPGSGSARKNWPVARWLELMDGMSAPILLILGEAEESFWSAGKLAETCVGRRLGDGSLEIAANLPLEALVTRLEACALFLGHDSGVSHLAAACGGPCVLLFGPTDPTIWAPPAPQVQFLRGGDDLSRLSVDAVRRATERALREQPCARSYFGYG